METTTITTTSLKSTGIMARNKNHSSPRRTPPLPPSSNYNHSHNHNNSRPPPTMNLVIPCEEDTLLPKGFKTTTAMILLVGVVLLVGQGAMVISVRESNRINNNYHLSQRALHEETSSAATAGVTPHLRNPNKQISIPTTNTTISTTELSVEEQDDGGLSDPLGWTSPWTGLEFESYKHHIDTKIKQSRLDMRHDKTKQVCKMPLYDGEYGYELAGMIPWAYWKSQKEQCHVHTQGRPGTKYLYYFSKQHTIQVKSDGLQRQSHSLPKESPFGFNGGNPHFSNDKFPTKGWLPPPYKDFFKRTDISLDKPLMVLSNKYTLEWSGEPRNNIPIRHLQEILKTLSQKYHIVYLRFQDKRLEDRLERKIRESGTLAEYRDKEMIKRFFPSVVLFEELSVGLDLEDINLMLFSLYATGDDFISVQGGNSVVASFFGGRNLIFCEEGPELWNNKGDFTYYHRFSGAKIQIANNTTDFMKFVPQWYY